MKENEIILLYEGDAWLSTSSLTLRGVFITNEDLRAYTQDMVAKGAIDDYGFDQLNNGYGQTSGIGIWSRSMFMVERTEVNPKEYNGWPAIIFAAWYFDKVQYFKS